MFFFVAEMGPLLGLIKFDAKMYGNFEGLFFDSVLFGLVSYNDRCVFCCGGSRELPFPGDRDRSWEINPLLRPAATQSRAAASESC